MGAQPYSDNYYKRLGLQTTVLPYGKRTDADSEVRFCQLRPPSCKSWRDTGSCAVRTQEEVNKMVYDNWSKSTNVITNPNQKIKLEEASPRLNPAQGSRRARLTLPGTGVDKSSEPGGAQKICTRIVRPCALNPGPLRAPLRFRMRPFPGNPRLVGSWCMQTPNDYLSAVLTHRQTETPEEGQDATTEQGQDSATEQGQDSATEQGQDGATEQGQDATTEQGQDATTEQGQDGATEQGQDGATEQGQDATTEQGQDATTEQGQDGATAENEDATEGAAEEGGEGAEVNGQHSRPQPLVMVSAVAALS
jgi:hypothetical protein